MNQLQKTNGAFVLISLALVRHLMEKHLLSNNLVASKENNPSKIEIVPVSITWILI
ncbi:hypothetical protein [Suttonella ornithocola]|uniref:hypothetical protein n=1 Tax=Suttonella ornithocola TaxID=279832 RepID=UPI0014710475|nr:hypothetical protein [Suttonella ornithocola]